MRTVLVGIDDTDTLDSIGTGAMARELGAHLVRHSVARVDGITRHQLLVHPDIPYTSHNSSACLELHTAAPVRDIAEFCSVFVRLLFHEGADPAICVAETERGKALLAYGERCQREVVPRGVADDLARETGVVAVPLGGTGGGVIGATAAVGLRAGGRDGRFLSARGIRGVRGSWTVAEIIEKTAIVDVVDTDGDALPPTARLEYDGEGVRPELRDGRAVLVLRPRANGGYEPLPRKKGEGDL